MGFRCVECGAEVERLLLHYSTPNIRLIKCSTCNQVADPYVECEIMILLIDVILHKQKAYRHLLFNMLNDNTAITQGLLWKSTLLYLALDGCRSLFLCDLTGEWWSSSNTSYPFWICMRLFMAIFLGNVIFLVTLFCANKFSRSSPWKAIGHKRYLLAILCSSYFKIYLLPVMVWEFPPSVVFLIDVFVLSSNTVALKVLTQLPTTSCIIACFSAHAAKFITYLSLLPLQSSKSFRGGG